MRALRSALHASSLAACVCAALAAAPASAGDEPYLGEVIAYGFDFCPRNFMPADGRQLPINVTDENRALHSLIGSVYGGDGLDTFALPDLRGAAPVQMGRGRGLQDYQWGVRVGAATVTIGRQHMPPHRHTLLAAEARPDTNNPAHGALPSFRTGTSSYARDVMGDIAMNSASIAASGRDGSDFDLRQPYLATTYCVAVVGAYPTRP